MSFFLIRFDQEFKETDDVALHFVARLDATAEAQFREFKRNVSEEVMNGRLEPPLPPKAHGFAR